MMRKSKKYVYTVLAAIIYGAVIIALFWKSRYGYAQLDEAFYTTIAYRFLQGDLILYDEWSNTQLSAVLLLPVIKAYMTALLFLIFASYGLMVFIHGGHTLD